MRKVHVLTCAYRGRIDEKLREIFTEVVARNRIDGLALIVGKAELPTITEIARENDIVISSFSSAKEFCDEYSSPRGSLRRNNYVVCITGSLGSASAVLKKLPKNSQTQLDTTYNI